jgi:hypothetical protein
VKYGCQCECGKKFSRAGLTHEKYAFAKVEHAETCRKMWDWLKRSGKDMGTLPRPA